MDLNGKRVLVVGLARSGEACARLLCALGAHVTVNDSKPAGDLTEYIGRLEGLEIEYRLGQGAMELVERLVSGYGVAVIPGTTFGLNEGCYLRVSYGALTEETVAEGVRRLVKGLGSILRGAEPVTARVSR